MLPADGSCGEELARLHIKVPEIRMSENVTDSGGSGCSNFTERNGIFTRTICE